MCVRPGLEDLQHPLVLVAEDELDGPVLVGLEAGRVAEHAPELRVLAGRQCREDRPLVGDGAEDVLDPGQRLAGAADVVGVETAPDGAQFVQRQLQPQLRGLVLDDEERLVVVVADRALRGQQRVQRQVTAVVHPRAEVRLHTVLDGADAVVDRHAASLSVPDAIPVRSRRGAVRPIE